MVLFELRLLMRLPEAPGSEYDGVEPVPVGLAVVELPEKEGAPVPVVRGWVEFANGMEVGAVPVV